MPTTLADYKWITQPNEKPLGFTDYVGCGFTLASIVDKAIELKKGHAKKNIILNWDVDIITSTGLVGYPHGSIDISMLDLSPTELRDRFLTVLNELDRFDAERATLLTTQTSVSHGVVWGFWRKGFGSGSGLDGVVEFERNASNPAMTVQVISRLHSIVLKFT